MSVPGSPPSRGSRPAEFSHSFFRSIRFRLALWFAVILALVLVLFGIFVYYRESQAVQTLAAARVSSRLRTVSDVIRRNMHENEEGNPLFTPGSAFILQDNEILILANASGKPTGVWGPATNEQANQLSEQAVSHESTPGFTVQLRNGNSKSTTKYIFGRLGVGYGPNLVGIVLLGQPEDPENQLPRLMWTLLLGGLLTLLGVLGGGYWLADRALRPVKAITHTAREIGETDLSQRLNLHTRDELGELANTFDSMLDRLQAAFARQRQFTADASHELRTPLTIIGLETDRALAAARSGEDYRRALTVIRSENEFMTRLVSELLTLARMDAGQVKLKCETLDLSDVALEVVERYTSLATRKGVRLRPGDLPELPIEGDRQYLSQMIGNLVDNAIKYTPAGPDQWVSVETGARTDGSRPLAWVRVSDNGSGIPAEHLPHLFDRFYRADSARSHNPEEGEGGDNTQDESGIPGSGLGLSIVQWIAQMHGGQVLVQSEAGKGSSFEIELPQSPAVTPTRTAD